MTVEEPVSLTIPDAPLEMGIAAIGEDNKDEIAASLYQNSTFENNLIITSFYIKEPVSQDGLLLYEIFANNDSWNYETFSAWLQRRFQGLNLRFTELKGFVCDKYNFNDNTCDGWQEAPSNILFSRGEIFATANAPKAQAFAIGSLDYDEDNAQDWNDDDNDNDGIPDSEDTFICANGRFKSKKFNITINDEEDLRKAFAGRNSLNINDNEMPLAEFDIDFDTERLDCREILVEKQPEITTRGYTILSGIELAEGTKTMYVDKIAALGEICIKDQEVISIEEVTEDCTGSDEYLIQCNSTDQNGYICADVGNQYKVEGLLHSAVAEPPACDEDWSCADWSSCSGGAQTRICTDVNSCGTNYDKPAEQQSCQISGGGGGGSGGGGGGGRSRVLGRGTIYQLGEIKGWSEGKTQTFEIRRNDLITFTFDNRYNTIVLNWIDGARISISLSFKSGFVLLRIGESKNFDIDNDGIDDIAVTFEDVSLSKIKLILKRINLIVEARLQINETQADITEPVSAELPQQLKQKPRS